MPYKWVAPELLVQHNNVEVYYVYNGSVTSSYWYTTNPGDDDFDSDNGNQFDVRDLPSCGLNPHSFHDHKDIIINAIEEGIVS